MNRFKIILSKLLCAFLGHKYSGVYMDYGIDQKLVWCHRCNDYYIK